MPSRAVGCFRLTYPSQRVSPGFARFHQLQKHLDPVWHRLGGRDDTPAGRWPRRPRGMHEATHARLKAAYERLTYERGAVLGQQLERLTLGRVIRRGESRPASACAKRSARAITRRQ
jgi:hypothetical protein